MTECIVPAMGSDFMLLDLAQSVVDEINVLLDTTRRMIHRGQLRDASGSITHNIREGYGRGDGGSRKNFLRTARASAEEADEQLRTNFAAKRVPAQQYWRLHNRLTVVTKMIDSLVGD